MGREAQYDESSNPTACIRTSQLHNQLSAIGYRLDGTEGKTSRS